MRSREKADATGAGSFSERERERERERSACPIRTRTRGVASTFDLTLSLWKRDVRSDSTFGTTIRPRERGVRSRRAARVSLSVSTVVSGPIRNVDHSNDSHSPCHYRRLSIVTRLDTLLDHSPKPARIHDGSSSSAVSRVRRPRSRISQRRSARVRVCAPLPCARAASAVAWSRACPQHTASICVSLLVTRSFQVRFGLWTVQTMKHGPWLSRTRSIVFARNRLHHSQNTNGIINRYCRWTLSRAETTFRSCRARRSQS